VAGRDGRCVICHRDDPDRGEGGGLVPILGLVVAGACLVAGVVLWKGSRRAPAAGPAVASAVVAPAAPPRPAEDERPGPPQIDEARAQARVAAEASRQRDIEAAMSRIPVRMYVIQKCEMCDAARTFLREKGISVIEIDVGEPGGLAAMRKLTPSTQVPVFDVDGQVLVGFGPTNVLAALRSAAERQNQP
jgi:glutaredoxin